MSSDHPGDIDLDLLYRFAWGRVTPSERELAEQWCAADPRRSLVADALGALAERPDALTERFDARAARARLARAIGVAGEPPARRVVLRARTARPVPPMRVAQLSTGGRVSRWGMAAAVALLVGGVWWEAARGGGDSRSGGVVTREYATARGQLLRVDLPDGTAVTLGAASTLSYAGGRERKVTLEGEAMFDVAHDERHPFEVRAGGVVARDVGTTFGVCAYPGDDAARVVVAAGSVALRAVAGPARGTRVLEPGELGRIGRDGATSVERVDPARYLAWARGRLEFDDVPLRDVVAQLARWYDVDIVLADTSLGGRRFTGAFEGETVDQVFDALTPPLHARYERRGRSIVLHTLPNEH